MRLTLPPFLLLTTGLALAGTLEADAFSQLGRQDGSLPQADGVIATPLPPLEAPATKAPVDPAATAQNPPAAPSGGATATPPSPPKAPGATSQTTSPPPANPAPTPPAAAPSAPAANGGTASPAAPSPGAAAEPEGTDPAASQQALPEEPAGPPPDVVYGDAGLPTPVRDLRAKLIEIAKSGEIEKLRPYIEKGEDGTVLSFGGVEGDPIDFLKSASGDGDGVETLAILLEVLEAGHIKSEAGTENEIYVWPYFAGLSVEKLTKPQKVELFELVTAGDYQEMVAFGAYNFYRVGISPDGKLQFFVAGD